MFQVGHMSRMVCHNVLLWGDEEQDTVVIDTNVLT